MNNSVMSIQDTLSTIWYTHGNMIAGMVALVIIFGFIVKNAVSDQKNKSSQ